MATATADGRVSKTDEIVEYLRRNPDEAASNRELAKRFGVSESGVRWARAKVAEPAAESAPAPVEIRIRDIGRDMGTQMRPQIDLGRVEEYMEGISDGRRDPVAIIQLEDGKNVLVDGFQRTEAHVRLGLDTVPAIIKPGTMDDAMMAAAGANADHGLPRSTATKRNAVIALLEYSDWSNRSTAWLASTAKVSRPFVESIRAERTKATEQSAERVGRDGKVRPAPAKSVRIEDEPEDDDDIEDVGEDASEDTPAAPVEKAPRDPNRSFRDRAATLPLADELEDERRDRFIDDAALYFRLAERRQALGDMNTTAKPSLEPGQTIGAYALIVERFMTTPHPKDWKLCKATKGREHGRRCRCGGRGYVVE